MLLSPHFTKPFAIIATVVAIVLFASSEARSEITVDSGDAADQLWLISTRCVTSDACCADLDSPSLRVHRLGCNGQLSRSALAEYLSCIDSSRNTVIYVHGNRMETDMTAVERGLRVYRSILRHRDSGPVNWVLWSWPSERQGFVIHDARVKASRTDAQGLYLAWMLRKHAEIGTPTTLIGYSLGGRVVTGALHALAGGSLGGRSLPGPAMVGLDFDAGLVAPAIEKNWLSENGYHSLATQNLDQMVLLYNRKDAVLKRYWWLDKVYGQLALGYTGPQFFAPRADGSQLLIRSRDCSPIVGLQHREVDYYRNTCRAGLEMANLIDENQLTH